MATIGPDRKISEFICSFIKEVEDDVHSPGASDFQDYMANCRKGVQGMEEVGWREEEEEEERVCEREIERERERERERWSAVGEVGGKMDE